MGDERKCYTPTYRRDAADLGFATGRTIVTVVAEIGSASSCWVAVHRSRTGEPPPVLDIKQRGELSGCGLSCERRAADGPDVPEKQRLPYSSRRAPRALRQAKVGIG